MAVHALQRPTRRNFTDASTRSALRPASWSDLEGGATETDPDTPGFVDNRPEAIAQRKQIDAIRNSPRAVAQEQHFHSLFGPNPAGLPDPLKSGIESLSGLSMDNVQVHYNSAKPAQFEALAYAQGDDIHVGPGQEQHLPHEAWHVVQQARGRVKPTGQVNEGISVNDDERLEQEADVMGTRALGDGVSFTGATEIRALPQSDSAPVQRFRGKKRGKKQLAKIALFGEKAPLNPVGRRKAALAAQADELLEMEKTNRRADAYAAHEARLSTAQENTDAQEQRHATGARREAARTAALREAGYAANQARLDRAQANRDEQERQHQAQRVGRGGRTQSEDARFQEQAARDQQELDEQLRALAETQRQAIEKKQAPVGGDAQNSPPLSAQEQFASDFPDAIRIGPLDSLKKVLRDTDFADHQSFVTSAFNKPSPTLPKFDGHTIYHDTQGGSGGGFTVFGVLVGGDRFLIAHGGHSSKKGVDYSIDWCCDSTVAGWTTKDISYGK